MASNSDEPKPMMQRTPAQEREILTRRMANALDDYLDRMAVRHFDGATGMLQVDVYPDVTRQDKPQRFTLKITHDLD